MKLWQKNNNNTPSGDGGAVEKFTVGNDREFDLLLAPFDVLGNIAHAKMLATVGLLAKTADGASVFFADGPRVKALSVESTVGEPFSLAYSFDYVGTLVATANGSCVPGYKGELFEGHLNEQGDVMRNASRWSLDSPCRPTGPYPMGDPSRE